MGLNTGLRILCWSILLVAMAYKGGLRSQKENIVFKAKMYAISSDTVQLQLIKLHPFKLEIFKSIYCVPGN